MLGRNSGSSLAAMAVLAAAGLGGMAVPHGSEGTVARQSVERSFNLPVQQGMPNVGGFLNSLGILGGAASGGRNPWSHNPPSGWTNRRYQRAARKKRNVARNRAAHR